MDNYVVQRLVGEGSFGKVYKARRKFTGRTVAIKVINKVGKPQKEVDSLRQELSILKTLKHPNIVEMLDHFETDKDFCVVMEYALGDLWEILEKDLKLPEAVVQSIAKQLIQALEYLHRNRIIHRDLKPQNVLLCAEGVVKLCDFGFARALSDNTIMLMSTKGTPLYMAPEMIQNHPYNETADLWSLGIILFELFAGKPPFFTNNVYTLIKHILHQKISYPLGMSADFRSFLEGLLNKVWRKRLTWPHLANHPFVRLTPEERARHDAAMAECLAQSRQRWPEDGLRSSSGSSLSSTGIQQETGCMPAAVPAASPPHFKSASSSKAAYMPMTQTVRRGGPTPRPRITAPPSSRPPGDVAAPAPSPAEAPGNTRHTPSSTPPARTPRSEALPPDRTPPTPQSKPQTPPVQHARQASPGNVHVNAAPTSARVKQHAACGRPPPQQQQQQQRKMTASTKAVSEPPPHSQPMGQLWQRNAFSDRVHGEMVQPRPGARQHADAASPTAQPTAVQASPARRGTLNQAAATSAAPAAAGFARTASAGANDAARPGHRHHATSAHAQPQQPSRAMSTPAGDLAYAPLAAHASYASQHSATSPLIAAHQAAALSPATEPSQQQQQQQQHQARPQDSHAESSDWSIGAISPRNGRQSRASGDSASQKQAMQKSTASVDSHPRLQNLDHLPNPLMPRKQDPQPLAQSSTPVDASVSSPPPLSPERPARAHACADRQRSGAQLDKAQAQYRSVSPATSGHMSPQRTAHAASPDRHAQAAASPPGSPPRPPDDWLQRCEALAGTQEGALTLWRDIKLAYIQGALARPSTGFYEWAGSEDLPRAAHTACQMLRWRQDGSEAVSKLQLAVLGAARAVGATHPATSAAIVGSVHVAEAAAAGDLDAFVAFEGTPQLYVEMLARPLKDIDMAATCCYALADAVARAQAVCQGNRAQEQQSEAQALLEWAKDSHLLTRLLKCFADSAASAEAADLQPAALHAIASLVSGRQQGSQDPAQPFPLALCLSHSPIQAERTTKVAAPSTVLQQAIKEKAAQELAARRSLVQMLTRAVTSGQEEVEDDALQLLLATCSCSPALCEAVCAAGIQKTLIALTSRRLQRHGLLLLAQLASGLGSQSRGKAPRAASAALLEPHALDALLGKLASLLQGAQADAAHAPQASAACHAAAALLGLSQRVDGAAARPPTAMLAPSSLAALRKLLGWVGGAASSPYEGADAAASRMGLLDGPAALCLALQVQAGAIVMQQNGITEAVVQLLASIARGLTPALSQLSPMGLLSILQTTKAAVDADGGGTSSLLLRQGVTLALATVLKPGHLDAVHAWPQQHGGGRRGTADLVAEVCKLAMTTFAPGMLKKDVIQQLQERMAQDGLLGALIRGMPAARLEREALFEPLLLSHNLMIMDVPAHQPFAHQYMQAGGLGSDCMSRILAARNSSRVLHYSLQMMMRLTGWGITFIAPMATHGLHLLAQLLKHRSEGTRAIVCKVIGTMYRTNNRDRNAEWAAHGGGQSSLEALMQQGGAVEGLLACLADSDEQPRAAACYAIGNIAYQTAALHRELAQSIPHLVKLTRTTAVKPRNNSVGALGNLLRLTPLLCQQLISHGALQAMINVAEEAGQPQDPGPRAATRPASTALLSLANAAAHEQCREHLTLLGIQAVLDRLRALQDPALSQSCKHVQAKMMSKGGQL